MRIAHGLRSMGAAVLAFVMLSSLASAAVPPLLVVQGVARTPSGDPIGDGSYSFQFAIYDDSTAGALLWSETQASVSVAGGLFTACLGTVAVLADSVFATPACWLQVGIGIDPPLPRIRLTTSPFAFRVATIDGADGGVVAGDVAIAGKVSVGSGHTNSGAAAFVAGQNNTTTGDWATVAGGESNVAIGPHNVIGGGFENATADHWTTIGGGNHNWAGAGSTVGGGWINAAGGLYSTIGGGAWNRTWGRYAVVVGGGGDVITDSNCATGEASAIGGGRRNVASALGATVSGGQSNAASANFATVPGGVYNRASGRFAFAAGRHAEASQIGSFVWADSLFDVVTSPGINTFTVRASGGIWLGANSSPSIPGTDFLNTSTGAHLTAGGVWTNGSDRSAKENFTEIDRDDLLRRISLLPVTRWNYRAEGDSVTHIGPVAQDFRGLFGVGTDDESISTIDPAGIALAAIQELYRQNQDQQREIAALNALVDELLATRK